MLDLEVEKNKTLQTTVTTAGQRAGGRFAAPPFYVKRTEGKIWRYVCQPGAE